MVMLCANYNDALAANLTAFVNRLTALFRQNRFYEKGAGGGVEGQDAARGRQSLPGEQALHQLRRGEAEYRMLSVLRLDGGLLEGCLAALVVTGVGELYTKVHFSRIRYFESFGTCILKIAQHPPV